jgi:hypothetical protein
MPSTWAAPAHAQPPRPPQARWNWAAGTVVGLAVLAAVLFLPGLADAARHGVLGDAQLEDWLVWGAGVVGIVAVAALATRAAQLVSVLSAVCAGLAIVGIVVGTDAWDASSVATWSTLATLAGFAVLGGCAAGGLRRS